jgi:hypothetical protein
MPPSPTPNTAQAPSVGERRGQFKSHDPNTPSSAPENAMESEKRGNRPEWSHPTTPPPEYSIAPSQVDEEGGPGKVEGQIPYVDPLNVHVLLLLSSLTISGTYLFSVDSVLCTRLWKILRLEEVNNTKPKMCNFFSCVRKLDI